MTDDTEEMEVNTSQSDESADSVATANIDSISDELAAEAPAPNDAAIAADTEKAEATKAQYADLRDADGNRFDPDIHVTDSNGEPKLTARGKLRKRPGRKAGGTTARASAKPSHVGGVAVESKMNPSLSPTEVANARISGKAAANALMTIGVVLGGDEFNPIIDVQHGVNEREQLDHAFGDYFEAKGMTDIPPGVALSIAVSAYVLPRLTMPKTQTRMGRLKEWFAVKLAKRKVRASGTQSDSRDDGKRQNNIGETTGVERAA